ncbi:MAG: hypothetical protein O3B13_04565 [Planctomycetota bacterium]|nr:hypothetical protein [Planctomycetota bacterium]MDA1162354.1 hypothetical protein [Planctomycetota bacterium]
MTFQTLRCCVSICFLVLVSGPCDGQETRSSTVNVETLPKIAGVTTVLRKNSHCEVIIGRLVRGYSLNDQDPRPALKLASLFTDQVPESDISREWSTSYGFPIAGSVREALTRGTTSLNVDGVLLVAEHGTYEKSATGNTMYPKRRLFGEVAETFRTSGRSVPVFIDKHLADNWTDAKWVYDQAKELKVPLMAGSSLPTLWRYPSVDTQRDAKIEEIVAVSYGSLTAYGFHALEMVQCLAERRAGGETGVRSVQSLTGDAVWEARAAGKFSPQLFDATLDRLLVKPWEKRKKTMEESVREPVLWMVEYRDGLRASVLTLNGAVTGWTAAWKYADDDRIESTRFQVQEERPFGHFTFLVKGFEKMMKTGRATWPVERTLLTSGTLDALLQSQVNGGTKLDTPWLDVRYTSDFNWQQPPEIESTSAAR